MWVPHLFEFPPVVWYHPRGKPFSRVRVCDRSPTSTSRGWGSGRARSWASAASEWALSGHHPPGAPHIGEPASSQGHPGPPPPPPPASPPKVPPPVPPSGQAEPPNLPAASASLPVTAKKEPVDQDPAAPGLVKAEHQEVKDRDRKSHKRDKPGEEAKKPRRRSSPSEGRRGKRREERGGRKRERTPPREDRSLSRKEKKRRFEKPREPAEPPRGHRDWGPRELGHPTPIRWVAGTHPLLRSPQVVRGAEQRAHKTSETRSVQQVPREQEW